ncbi:MAG: pyruvate ferredoxin oxidoreductase [archaeon]
MAECSEAIASAAASCKLGVIATYPITPQTHIVEKLAKMHSEGKLNAEVINVESEHSAMSACIGAEACGVRTFTASSSQGIALMSEMLFIASGMRLPIVMAVANRAVSSPINIWNDHSDTMAQRDSGWLQIYCESSQEAYDSIIQAYKIAEQKNVMLPVMVCVDGFTLSHLWEPMEEIKQGDIDSFLPAYNPINKLDTDNPKTLGALAYPNTYMQFKKQQQDAMANSLEAIKKSNIEFGKKFNRTYGDGLVETYRIDDAKEAIVAMGSVCSTARIVIDKLRQQGRKIGMIKIRAFRPFPSEAIKKIACNIDKLAVIDRAVSLGSLGPLFLEIKAALPATRMNNFIVGLGGRDINENIIGNIIKKIGQKQEVEWIF